MDAIGAIHELCMSILLERKIPILLRKLWRLSAEVLG